MKLFRDIKENYTIVPNEIQKYGLSLQALGLYLYIISKPDGWNFSVSGVSQQVKNGIEAINSAIKELETTGFLYRQQLKDNNKFGVCVWYITDKPHQNEAKLQDLPLTGKPVNGNTMNGKPLQVITKEVKTNKVTTKVVSKYTTLNSLTEEDFNELASYYKVSEVVVRNCYDKLSNYCLSKGKQYKNYKAALRNFILGDLEKNPNLKIKTVTTFTGTVPEVSDEVRQKNHQRYLEMREKIFGGVTN